VAKPQEKPLKSITCKQCNRLCYIDVELGLETILNKNCLECGAPWFDDHEEFKTWITEVQKEIKQKAFSEGWTAFNTGGYENPYGTSEKDEMKAWSSGWGAAMYYNDNKIHLT
jgi:hypothetical protein